MEDKLDEFKDRSEDRTSPQGRFVLYTLIGVVVMQIIYFLTVVL